MVRLVNELVRTTGYFEQHYVNTVLQPLFDSKFSVGMDTQLLLYKVIKVSFSYSHTSTKPVFE